MILLVYVTLFFGRARLKQELFFYCYVHAIFTAEIFIIKFNNFLKRIHMMSHSFQKESDELSVSCDKLYSKLSLMAFFQSVALIILTVGLTGMYVKFSHSNYMAAFFIMLFIIQCISDPLTKAATDVFSALGTTYHNLTSKAEYCIKLVSRVRSLIFLFVSAEVFVFVLFLLFSHFKIALICLLILSAFAVDGKSPSRLFTS